MQAIISEWNPVTRARRFHSPLVDVHWVAFLVSFGVYVFTLAPGFVLGDSGELIAGALTLGIVHPPGYSLYLLAGRLFLALPIPGDIAWRMNLFTALCGACAVSLFCLLLKRILVRLSVIDPIASVSALGGALLFAFSKTWWSQCVITEVYSLQMAIVAGVLLAIERNRFDVGCFLMGLALIAHPGSVLVLPILVWGILRDTQFSPSRTLSNLFLFAVGVSPALYLFLRGTGEPWQDWGMIGSFGDAVNHLLRREYGGLDWNRYVALGWMLERYSFSIVEQWSVLGVAAAVAGFVALRRLRPSLSDLWLAGFVLTGPLAVVLLTGLLSPSQRMDIEPFCLLSYLFPAGLMSVAVAVFLSRFPALTIMAVICLLGVVTVSNGQKVSQTGNSVPEEYVRLLLEDIPGKARIVPLKDSTSYALDYAGAEKRLPDGIQICRFVPRLEMTPVEYIESLSDDGATVLTDLVPGTWSLRRRMEPTPLWMRIREEPVDTIPQSVVEELTAGFAGIRDAIRGRQSIDPTGFERLATSTHFVDVAILLEEHGRTRESQALYEEALVWNPYQVEAHLRLADRALDQRQFERTQRHLSVALRTAPFHVPAYVLRGRLKLLQGDIEAAISDWERAGKLDPKDEVSKLLLAKVYMEIGEKTTAQEVLYELLRVHPENTEARRLLAEIHR